MKKMRIFCQAFFLLAALFFLFPSAAYAASEQQRVFDNGNFLTAEEREKLEAECKKSSEKLHAELIILTENDDSVIDIEENMKALYDELNPGEAVMLGIDLSSRQVCVSAFGRQINRRINHDRETAIREKISPELTKGQYYDAVRRFLKLTVRYAKVKPGVNPDSIFFSPLLQLVAALTVGAIAVGVMTFSRKPKMTANSQTYLDQSNARILARRDRYIRTTVTRQRKPQNDDHGNSSGGSSGGGSDSYSSSKGSF